MPSSWFGVISPCESRELCGLFGNFVPSSKDNHDCYVAIEENIKTAVMSVKIIFEES